MTERFEVSQAGFTMQATLTTTGADHLIQLTGGDVPHLGVVTTVDRQKNVHTTALPSRPGHVHQEGALTKRMAKVLAPLVSGNLFLVAGMHVNQITAEQMKAAFAMTDELTQQLAEWLKAHPSQPVEETFAPHQD